MVLPGDCTHARGRSSRGASALCRVLCGVLFAEGVLGAYYTVGHSMGSSAHLRGCKAVLTGTLVWHCLCAAGVTWTSRTPSAPWAARVGHTTVIDAAGAIYVIGGVIGSTHYKDVWVSTDGGADRTRGEELL
jgi:hypothetical protein